MKAQPSKPVTVALNATLAPTITKRSAKASKKLLIKAGVVSGKLGKIIALLNRPKGATIAELMKATGWQAHSVRGAIAGAIKKKQKLAVVSEKTGSVRTYRIKG